MRARWNKKSATIGLLGLVVAVCICVLAIPLAGATTGRHWPAGKTIASGTLGDGSSWYLDAAETPECFAIKLSVGMGNGISSGCGREVGDFRISTAWLTSSGSAAGVVAVAAPAGTKAVKVVLPAHGGTVTRRVTTPRRSVGDVVAFVAELPQQTNGDDIVVHAAR